MLILRRGRVHAGLRSSKAAALFGQARERLLELGALNVRDSQLPQAGLRASEAEAATAAAAAQPADVKRVDEPGRFNLALFVFLPLICVRRDAD